MIRVIYIEVRNAGLCQCRETVKGHQYFGRSGGVFQRVLAVSVQAVHQLHKEAELRRTGCCLPAAEHLHCGPMPAGWAASLSLWCCTHNDFTMTLSTEKHCFCYRWFSLPVLQMGGLCRAGFWLCSAWGFFCLSMISSSYWESRNAFFGWGRDICKSSSPESCFFRYCPRTKTLLKKIWKLIV